MKTIINHWKNHRGQSLVEVALFLPIFLIMIAGVVEVSLFVITQNRVSNAARVGARFGANGGEDAGIVTVAINSVTQTFAIITPTTDIWVVRGTINQDGTDFEEFTFEHAYGVSQTVRAADVNVANIRDNVLNELQVDNQNNRNAANAAGVQIVGVYMIHDEPSILGLDAFSALSQFSSVQSLNVMRITGLSREQTQGCDAFPIAVHDIQRSVNPPGSDTDPYPDENDFTYPDDPPTYESFIYHRPGVPLEDAREGYIYKIKNGQDPGNFGWLVWNTEISANANTLADSLSWPGDSTDYRPLPGGKFRGYQEPEDPTDRSLHIDDWVAGSSGSINSNAVRNILEGHVESQPQRALRVILWNTSTGAGGVNVRYQISGFAIFRLIGYSLDQSDGSWILAEFVRMDDSCGQPQPDVSAP